jgi:hypothetical protein
MATEASHTVPPPARTVTILAGPAGTITLAKYYARKAVIEDWRAAGIRWREYGAAEINTAAVEYLGRHPELIERAIAAFETSPRLRQLAEMERRRREREKRSANRASANAHSMRPSASRS